jgi:hypothetical protein
MKNIPLAFARSVAMSRPLEAQERADAGIGVRYHFKGS